MNPMRDALKSKRGGGSGMLMQESAAPAEESGGGMQDLVAQLSPDQKQELMGLLSKDMGQGQETTEIEKGEPSDEERGQIEARMGQEGELSEDESDDASMEMLDHKDKVGTAGEPRNLGERVRMSIASKLKGKGKL